MLSERARGWMHGAVRASVSLAVTPSVIALPIGRKAGASKGLRGSPYRSALMTRHCRRSWLGPGALARLGNTLSGEMPTQKCVRFDPGPCPSGRPQINIVPIGGQGRAIPGLARQRRGRDTGKTAAMGVVSGSVCGG